MNKRIFSAIISLIAALMFTTAAVAQEKATTPAPTQEKAAGAMTAAATAPATAAATAPATAAAKEKATGAMSAATQEKASAAMTAAAKEKAAGAMTAATEAKPASPAPAPTQEKAAAVSAPAKAMKSETFNGVVESVDTAKNNVTVEYHKDRMTFTVNDKTKLFEGGKALKLSEVNKGLWASVEYQKEGNQSLAQSIHVGPVKQSMKTASSKGTTESKMMPSSKTTENK
jgi:hypothetical protein